jgi:cell division cycle protein 37
LRRWKQQDIHQKRQERTLRIAKLRTEADLNDKLRPRIVSTISSLSSSSPASAKESLSSYASLIHQLTTNPSDDKPPTGAPNQPTYDVMLLHLLEQVWKEAKEALGLNPGEVGGGEGKEEELREKLRERLAYHNESLDKRTKECRQEAEREEKEEKKKITSEGIHDGFSSGVSLLFGLLSAGSL